jgi:hypothetical protein
VDKAAGRSLKTFLFHASRPGLTKALASGAVGPWLAAGWIGGAWPKSGRAQPVGLSADRPVDGRSRNACDGLPAGEVLDPSVDLSV